MSTSSARGAGVASLAAGPLALAGLVLGLQLAGYDAEAFRDPEFVLGLGADAAGTLRASFLLVMLGSYLLVVPLALWLAQRLGDGRDWRWRLTTVAGLAYLGLGAAGSCILAAVWPDLVRQQAAGEADPQTLVVAFRTATRIAEDGLQGAMQNLAGALWWAGLGVALRRAGRGGLGWFTLALAAGSTLNTLGALLSVEALTLVGLTLTVLLAPVWAVVLGVAALRDR
jgi:hypothetical protein